MPNYGTDRAAWRSHRTIDTSRYREGQQSLWNLWSLMMKKILDPQSRRIGNSCAIGASRRTVGNSTDSRTLSFAASKLPVDYNHP
ncbi:MAG: hypothetical protein GDA56_29240 [Hormoscilla sp. GM7CHS1pb]|nr:hypothetical protein [Hormoscilla sp. GM7CHS1pb]